MTLGGEGSQIYSKGECIDIPCAKAVRLADPTGCGDAYRAGLLYGLMQGMDWQSTGRIASLLGTLKMESVGPQNHRFERSAFDERFKQEFGFAL